MFGLQFATLLYWVTVVFMKTMTLYTVMGLWHETSEVNFRVKWKLDSLLLCQNFQRQIFKWGCARCIATVYCIVSQHWECVSIPSSWLDLYQGVIRNLKHSSGKEKEEIGERRKIFFVLKKGERKKKKLKGSDNVLTLHVPLSSPLVSLLSSGQSQGNPPKE